MAVEARLTMILVPRPRVVTGRADGHSRRAGGEIGDAPDLEVPAMTFRPGGPVVRRTLFLAAVATAAAPAAALAAYPSPAAVRSALATERYYMSYGSAAQPSPAPVAAPSTPALGRRATRTGRPRSRSRCLRA